MASGQLKPCSIGTSVDDADNCHQLVYKRSAGLLSWTHLPSLEQGLILRRAGLERLTDPNPTLCHHHHQVYGAHYEKLQRACCDPWKHTI